MMNVTQAVVGKAVFFFRVKVGSTSNAGEQQNQTLMDLYERLMPAAFILVSRCDQTLRAGVASCLCGPVSRCCCNIPAIVTALCVVIRGRRPAWWQAMRHKGLKYQQCKAAHVRITAGHSILVVSSHSSGYWTLCPGWNQASPVLSWAFRSFRIS